MLLVGTAYYDTVSRFFVYMDLYLNKIKMIKTDWSITSQYWNWTREDFLFTYDEKENQEIAFNKFVTEQEIGKKSIFIAYEWQFELWFTQNEAMLYNFIDWYTRSNRLFWYSTMQISKKMHISETSVKTTINSLIKKWYVIKHPWKDKHWNERRFLSTTWKYSSELAEKIGWSKSDWGVGEIWPQSNINSIINNSKIWIYGNSNNPIKNDKSNSLNSESRAGELDVCARVESYEDIQQVIEDDTYRVKNNKLLKCIVKMCELWYQVDKKEKPIRELVEWIKEKAEIYNIKNSDWTIAQWTMLQIFDQWCEYWKSKGKVTNHKNSVMRFMINYNKPYKKK